MNASSQASRKISVLRVALAVALVGIPAMLLGYHFRPRDFAPDPLLVRLMAKHRGAYSQFHEEYLIAHFFENRRGGFFVDVGASHPEVDSTTCMLERELGWRGLAIDPIAAYAPLYEKLRPNTRFFPFFAGERSDQTVDFFVNNKAIRLSSGSKESAFEPGCDAGCEEIRVQTIALNDLLAREKAEKVDFLSIDVEGAELRVLLGLDIDRHRPALVCIETRDETTEAVESFFAEHGYVELTRYAKIDWVNKYFAPRESPRIAQVQAEP